MPTLPRAPRCAASSALLPALVMTVAQTVMAQTAPAALQPAESHHTVATLPATGVQIYVYKRDGDKPLAWIFKTPLVELYDANGKLIVKHGTDSSWEASDGSKITGKVLQQAPNTTEAGAIPLLLLQAAHTGGAGVLDGVRYVQRLQTHDGIALAQPCTEEDQEGRSPYLAQYVFLDQRSVTRTTPYPIQGTLLSPGTPIAKTHTTGYSPRRTVVICHSRRTAMGRCYIDCRAFPSETNCSVAISADNGTELLETTVQRAVSVHKYTDSPELWAQLQTLFRDGAPAVTPPRAATA